MLKIIRFFPIIAALVLVGAGCYGYGTPQTATPADDSVSGESAEEGVTAVSAFNFGYNPDSLTVTEGEAVRLSITSDGTHTFTIDELGVNERLSRGTNSVTFTPSDAGSFSYYCAIPGHRERGMVGTLNVSSVQ